MGAAAAVALVVLGWATIIPGILRGTTGVGTWYLFCLAAFAVAGVVCVKQAPAPNLRDAAVAGALGQVGGIVYGMMQGVPLTGAHLVWIAIAAAAAYGAGYWMLNQSMKGRM